MRTPRSGRQARSRSGEDAEVGASGAESFAFVRSRSRSSVRSESFALVRSFGIVRGRSFVRPFKTSLVKYSKVGVQRKTTGTRGGTRGYNRRLPNVRRSSRGDAQSWLSREMRGTQACETEPRVRGGDGLDARGGGDGCGGGGGGGGGFLGGGDARPSPRTRTCPRNAARCSRTRRRTGYATPTEGSHLRAGRRTIRATRRRSRRSRPSRPSRPSPRLRQSLRPRRPIRRNPPRRRRDRTRRGRRSRRRRLRRRRLFCA